MPSLSTTNVERITQSFLWPSSFSRKAVVARNTEDHAVELGEVVFVIGEIGGFEGAVRRAIAWVEEQYRVLPTAQRSEIEPLHIGIGQRKLGCLFPCVQHSLSSDSHRDSL